MWKINFLAERIPPILRPTERSWVMPTRGQTPCKELWEAIVPLGQATMMLLATGLAIHSRMAIAPIQEWKLITAMALERKLVANIFGITSIVNGSLSVLGRINLTKKMDPSLKEQKLAKMELLLSWVLIGQLYLKVLIYQKLLALVA